MNYYSSIWNPLELELPSFYFAKTHQPFREMLMYTISLTKVLNPMLLEIICVTIPRNFFNKEPIQRFLLLEFAICEKMDFSFINIVVSGG